MEAAARYRELHDAAGAQRASQVQEAAEAGQRHLAMLLLASGLLVLAASAARWWAQQRRAELARARAAPRREEGIVL
jgi:hypothetical protein